MMFMSSVLSSSGQSLVLSIVMLAITDLADLGLARKVLLAPPEACVHLALELVCLSSLSYFKMTARAKFLSFRVSTAFCL